MKAKIGTSYFVSRIDAIIYYSKQKVSPVDVRAKIKLGEISIGMPSLLEGELAIPDMDGRYIIYCEDKQP